MNMEQRLWLDHTTGKQPVSNGTIVEVILKDGTTNSEDDAQHFRWDCLNKFDIEKYRVLPDADGWIENTGVQPVADGVMVDTKWVFSWSADECNHRADAWKWGKDIGITHWRFHQKAEEKPLEPPRVMRLSEQVALLETDKHTLEMIVETLKAENADLKSKLEQIKGLV